MATQKRETYLRRFETEDAAWEWMCAKNRTVRSARHRHRDTFALVEGPADDWAVVDLRTAIELEMPYRWWSA